MDSQSQNLVSTFQRLFLAGQHLNFFPWKELEEQWKKSLDHLLLLDILKRTVRHPLCAKYPPSVKYMRIFLLELIKKHESTATEPLDELYEALGKVLNMEESTQCHKSYFLPSGESITLLESLAIISMGTTGLVTWKAALYLSEWAMEVSDLFNNRTVLELGSGIGLTGLVICKTAHPKKYIFSDCHEEVLQQLTRNIQLNGFHVDNRSNPQSIENLTMTEGDLVDERSSEIIIKEFDWEKVTEEQLSELKIDIAIAADVVYDPKIIPSLISVLKRLNCKKNEKSLDVYLASTIRNIETYNVFLTELEKVGLEWEVVPGHKRSFFFYDDQSNVEIIKVHT